MTLGAIVFTAVALFVGLGVLYLSWRFVSGLPTDRPGEPVEKQEAERVERELAREAEAREAQEAPETGPRRTSPSEWVAGIAITLGLVALALFFIRGSG